MPIQFHSLPVELFPSELQPFIARLNRELREQFGLEGVLRNPVSVNRSDSSIVRRASPQVDISRITPEPAMAISVNGTTTTIGTPALTLGTANAAGSTTTVISVNSTVAVFGAQTPSGLSNTAAVGTSALAARADHVHEFPTSLQSDSNNATLLLTDNGTDETITGSLGNLTASIPGAYSFQTTGNPSAIVNIIGTPGGGQVTLMSPAWGSGAVSNTTIRCWDAKPQTSGILTGMTLCGYDTSAFTVTPSSTSDNNNAAYCARLSGPNIANNLAGWSFLAALLAEAPRRSTINAFTVSTAATVIAECPTVSGTSQIGVWIRQRAAQVTATNRYGVYVEAQNSGTNRYAFYGVSDILFHAGQIKHTGVQIGLYGATPTVRFGTTGTEAGFTAGTSTAVTEDSTFTGNTGTFAYTIGDLVLALKKIGALTT